MDIVTEDVVRALVTEADALAVAEQAFIDLAQGRAIGFEPLMAHGSNAGNRFGVKAAFDGTLNRPGLKLGTYWSSNRAKGLPAHGSTTLLLDDETGHPAALIAATHLNALRTAAADAVAVRALARPDATSLGIVGAGNQAFRDLLAIRQVRPISRVRIWSRDAAKARLMADQAADLGLDAAAAELEVVVREADILVTATAAREPLVSAAWLKPGAHISAMGADGPGKQELDPMIVGRADLFADLPRQSVALGEFQHAARAGLISADDVAAIGHVLSGERPGRTSEDCITVFDSSGVAAQDIPIAALAWRRALEAGRVVRVDLDGPDSRMD